MNELNYSTENATINRAMFFIDFKNPIVFVEDKDKEFWYQTILRRMFPNVKFEINPCGGKPNVEEAYKLFFEKYDDCKCIYLCDGDFDILINRERIKSTNFIYLKKYEIENYVVDKNSLTNFLLGRIYGTYENAQKILNYDVWYSNIILAWYELMIAYIIAQRNELGDIENTGINPERYIKIDSYSIDTASIDKYKTDLSVILNKKGKDIKIERKIVEKAIERENINKEDIVKGKYILVSAKKYIIELIKKTTGGKTTFVNDDVFNLLLHTFDVNSLDYVKNQIEVILKS